MRAAAIDKVEVESAELDGALTAADVVDLNTGEVIVEANVELTADRLHKVLSSGAASFEVFFPERDDVGNIITNTLQARLDPQAGRGADRDLPQAASGRSADAGYGDRAL